MPVILDAAGAARWLDAAVPFEECAPLLRPFQVGRDCPRARAVPAAPAARGPQGALEWHAVSERVNQLSNHGPEVIEPLANVKVRGRASSLPHRIAARR